MIDMAYTVDIVFIKDINKKEFLNSILKEGINIWIDLFKEKQIMKMPLILSHLYDEGTSREIYNEIKEKFIDEFIKLEVKFDEINLNN